MSETKKKSKTGNRYPGVDTAPWKVVYTTKPTTAVKDETFPSFSQAQGEAQRYIDATGEHASAARA